MKLLFSTTSPFSSKVRMAARYLDIELTEIRVDTNAGPALLIDNNPLGKIPVLLPDRGEAIYDSRSITHYFDRLKGKKLYPSKKEKRTQVEVIEALCDGACECLLSIVYERRFRPEGMTYQPWIDRQWEKVSRTLNHLSVEHPKIGRKLNAGHFALATLIGYLQLRFEGQWEENRGELLAWATAFEKAFPDFASLKPQT